MTVTYTDNAIRNDSIEAGPFVPRYARARRAKKGVRTWMILAPIGALALIGGGAAMIMGGAPEARPLVEPQPLAPVVRPLEAARAPLESAVAPSAPTTSASVAREAPPAPPPAVQRRDAGERRVAPAPAATPRVETAPEPTGPQAYSASPSTAAPASPPVPAIQTTPLN